MNQLEKRRRQNIWVVVGTIFTVVLAVAVVSISLFLESRGAQPTAPTAPTSKPRAAQAGTCSLQFTLTADASPSPSPSVSPSPSPSVSPSPSPSPVPACNTSCTTNAQCPSGLTCSSNACRNPLCTGSSDCSCPVPSPTPPQGCNNSCVTNSDCASGMVCSSSLCRNASCTSEPNCLCPGGTTPTPIAVVPTPPPTLPKAGSVLGTTTVFGLGTIITILGVIGFMVL